MYQIIFIAGAPGSGKSTVTHALHKQFGSLGTEEYQQEFGVPMFEFSWIPEFRRKNDLVTSYTEDEALAFENLTIVLRNYVKHGYNNILVTDLADKHILELHNVFQNEKYLLVTLTIDDNETLKQRVLSEDRYGEYREWEEAQIINSALLQRDPLPNEFRIDVSGKSVDEVVEEAYSRIIKEGKV